MGPGSEMSNASRGTDAWGRPLLDVGRRRPAARRGCERFEQHARGERRKARDASSRDRRDLFERNVTAGSWRGQGRLIESLGTGADVRKAEHERGSFGRGVELDCGIAKAAQGPPRKGSRARRGRASWSRRRWNRSARRGAWALALRRIGEGDGLDAFERDVGTARFCTSARTTPETTAAVRR